VIKNIIVRCSLPKEQADELNQASGRIYTRVLVEHYRAYRHTGHWLSCFAHSKMDAVYQAEEKAQMLSSYSVDAAREGFYNAAHVAWVNQANGAKYPHKRRMWRTTVWKNPSIRLKDGYILLSQAKGWPAIQIPLPASLSGCTKSQMRQVSLVWDKAAQRYYWHICLDDGVPPAEPPGEAVGALDLGEVHPAAFTERYKNSIGK
jgi:hypothetical protein